MRTEKMTLDKWYGRSIRIPDYQHWNYTNFVGSCMGIVRSIMQERCPKEVAVRFTIIPTASADIHNNIINISSRFLQGYFGDSKGGVKVDSSVTITALCGLIVHEAAHFAWSPPLLDVWGDHINKHTKCIFNREIAQVLGNVVEDIYIEAEVDRVVPSLTWMLDTLNGILFDQNDMDKRLRDVAPIDAPPTDRDGIGKVLDLLILAKTNAHLPLTNAWQEKLFYLARSAALAGDINQRFDLALAIYDEMMANYPKDKGNSRDAYSLGGAFGEQVERSKGLTAGNGGVLQPSEIGKDHWSQEINDTLNRTKGCTIRIDPNMDTGGIKSPTSMFIEKYIKGDSGNPKLQMDVRYNRLAEIGRQNAVVNRPYGLDMNRGHSIRKLHRIATDSKIFAERVEMNDYKPMQVLILLDCSGSMDNAGVSRHIKSNLQLAAEAGYGATIALSEARCDVALYGHTADFISGNDCVIYRIKGFQDSIEGMGLKLAQLVEDERHSNNRDGYAIGYLTKKLSDWRKKRVMIVVSDGQPAGRDGYAGVHAVEHTRIMVEKAKAQGIKVISISITEGAREANDRIYGRENNIFNTDPNVISQLVHRLVTR